MASDAPELLAVHTDRFSQALFAVVSAATLVSWRGRAAAVVHDLGLLAIASPFFLQEARLS